MTDNKWQLSARACCTTLMASVAGGWVALVQSYFMNNKKQDVLTVVNGILGALVGVTGGCAVFNIYSAMVVGAVGSFMANITPPLLEYWRIDDAVGATCVHGFGGAWGMIAIGLFAQRDEITDVGFSRFLFSPLTSKSIIVQSQV